MASIIPRTQGRDLLAVQLAARRPLQRHLLHAPLLVQLLQAARPSSAAPASFTGPTRSATFASSAPPRAVAVSGLTPIQRRPAPPASTSTRPAGAPAAPLLARRMAESATGAIESATDAAGPLPAATPDQLAASEARDGVSAPLVAASDDAERSGDDAPTDLPSQVPEEWELAEPRQAGDGAPAPLSAPTPPETRLQRQSGPPLPPSAAAPSAGAAAAPSPGSGARAVGALNPSDLRAAMAERSGASPLATPMSPPPEERSLPHGVEAFEPGEPVASASEAFTATPGELDNAEASSGRPEPPVIPPIDRRDDSAVGARVQAAPAAASTALGASETVGATAEPPLAPAPGRPALEPRNSDAPPPGQPHVPVVSPLRDEPMSPSEALPPVLPAAVPADALSGSASSAMSIPEAPTLLPVAAMASEPAPPEADQEPAATEPLSLSAIAGAAAPLPLDVEQHPSAAPTMDAPEPLPIERGKQPSGTGTATTTPPGDGPSAQYGSVRQSAAATAVAPAAQATAVAQVAWRQSQSPPQEPAPEPNRPSAPAAVTPAAAVQRTSTRQSASPTVALPAADGNVPEQIEPTLPPPSPTGSLAAQGRDAAEASDDRSGGAQSSGGSANASLPSADHVAPTSNVPAQRTAVGSDEQSGAAAAEVVEALPTAPAALAPGHAVGSPTLDHALPSDEPALPADSPAAGDTGEVANELIQRSSMGTARRTRESGDDALPGASAPAAMLQPAITSGNDAPRSTTDLGTALLTDGGDEPQSAAPVAAAARSLPVAASLAPRVELPLGAAGPAAAAPAPVTRVAATPEGLAGATEQRAAERATEQRIEATAAARPTAAVQRSVDDATAPESTADDAAMSGGAAMPADPGVIAAEPAINPTDAPRGAPEAGAISTAPVDLPSASAAAPSDDGGAVSTPSTEAASALAAATDTAPAVSDTAEPAPVGANRAEPDAEATLAPIQRTAAAEAPLAASDAAAPAMETVSPRRPRPIFRRRQPEPEQHVDAPSPPPDPAVKERLERLATMLLGETAALPTERPTASAPAAPGGIPSTGRIASTGVVRSIVDASFPTHHEQPAAPGAASVPLQRATAPGVSAAATDLTPSEADRSASSETGAPSPAIDRQATPFSTVQRAATLAPAAPLPAPLPRTVRAHHATPLSADSTAAEARAWSPGAAIVATFEPTAPAAFPLSVGDRADDAPRWGTPPVVQARDAGPFPIGAPEAHASVPPSLAPQDAIPIGSPSVAAGAQNAAGQATHALPATVHSWPGTAPSVPSDPSATVQRAVARHAPPSALELATSSADARCATGEAPAEEEANDTGGQQARFPARDRARWGNLPAPWEPLPTWLTAPAPAPSAPQASPPAPPSLPVVVQRTVPAETPERPISAPEAPNESPSTQQPDADLDALARQVYGILRQRLLMEQRRGG